MAVSLKKREKVDLSKPDTPPKLREYTPVHLLDEEETIQRPRCPPTQPQSLGKSNTGLDDVEVEIKTDNKKSVNKQKRFNSESFRPLIIFILSLLGGACIFVLLYFLTAKFSSTVDFPVESIPAESVSNIETSAATAVESTLTYDISSSAGELLGGIHYMLAYIIHSPVCVAILGLAAICVLIKVVRNITKLS